MKCPFCSKNLTTSNNRKNIIYSCLQEDCLLYGIPRYKALCDKQENIINTNIILGQYYLFVDYPNNITVISTLDCIILKDSVTIHKALEINFNKLPALLEKINTLMLFS